MSRRVRLIAIGAGIALVLVSAAALQAQSQENPRITDVKFTGLKRVSEAEALKAVQLRPGDILTPRGVDDAIRALDKLGCFYPVGISVRREPYLDGVRLIFELAERPVVSDLKFEGNRAFDSRRLADAVGLKVGSFIDFAVEKLATSHILDLYREKGYQFAEVKREDKEDKAANSVAITFTVKEGPQVTLVEVRFDGNKAFSDRQLASEIETATVEWLIFPKAFNENAFKLDLVRVQEFYKTHGYLDALVSGDYEYSLDKTKLTAIIKINEGAQYKVGDVTLRGEKAFTGEELAKQLKLKKGEPFDGTTYDRDARALREFYTARGYLEVQIDHKELFPEAGRIDLVYTIDERTPVRLGMIEVRGNIKTKQNVVLRAFGIYPGDVYDTTKVERGLNRLRELRYFKTVEETVVPGGMPDERNLVVEVEEQDTGRLMFGAGISSNNGLIGQLDVAFENFDVGDAPSSWRDFWTGNAFVGAGQRLELMLQPGTEVSQARLLFVEPHLLDSDWSVSTDFFIYQRLFADYNEGRAGFRIGVGRQLTDDLTARLTFRFEQVDISSVSDDAPPDVVAVGGTGAIRSIILGTTYDRTDSFWMPTKGYKLTGSVEVATDALGSDWNFVKGVIDGDVYKTVYETREGRKHILALGGRLGAVDSFGGSPFVPLFERFYVGGRDSVRGFSFRGLGPHQGDTPVGGEFEFVGNVQYLFPIYQTYINGKPFEMIRGVIFYDLGTVAYTLGGSAPVRNSVGFGVRLHIPGLGGIPIAFDFGFPINKVDGDDTQIFSFNIGTVF